MGDVANCHHMGFPYSNSINLNCNNIHHIQNQKSLCPWKHRCLQVLHYSKSKRNGSSSVRHSLIHEVKTGFVCIWILRSAHLGCGDTFAFLSARNSSAAQLSSNQAFSFNIFRLRKEMLTFNT